VVFGGHVRQFKADANMVSNHTLGIRGAKIAWWLQNRSSRRAMLRVSKKASCWPGPASFGGFPSGRVVRPE